MEVLLQTCLVESLVLHRLQSNILCASKKHNIPGLLVDIVSSIKSQADMRLNYSNMRQKQGAADAVSASLVVSVHALACQ